MAPRYGLSQSQIALIFSAYLFGIASSPIAGALADRFGRAPVLIGGVLTMSLGEVLTLQESLPGIFCGISILTIGFFSAHTVASGWVGLWAGSNKGHAAAMYLLAYYFGSSALGTCGGWFWEVGGWSMVVEFALTLLVIALFVAMRLAQLAARGTPA
jgi:YNFM family putative membrane transporter